MMKKYLIDTHVIIWFYEGDKTLPKKLRKFLENQNENIYVSMISIWEISIKRSIGKLELKENTSTILQNCEKHWNIINGFTAESLESYENLPLHHRDPFDRMLIAQAKTENLTIITKDANFSKYDVNILWK